MEVWFILLIIILCITLTYISKILEEKFLKPYFNGQQKGDGNEGFENKEEVAGAYPESKGLIRWLDNTELYDSFYCGIYDQLTQGSVRTQAEVGLALNEWTKKGEDLKTFEVLDAGCGTGIANRSFNSNKMEKAI